MLTINNYLKSCSLIGLRLSLALSKHQNLVKQDVKYPQLICLGIKHDANSLVRRSHKTRFALSKIYFHSFPQFYVSLSYKCF